MELCGISVQIKYMANFCLCDTEGNSVSAEIPQRSHHQQLSLVYLPSPLLYEALCLLSLPAWQFTGKSRPNAFRVTD